MTWTRRTVLRALASAPAVSALAACASQSGRKRRSAVSSADELDPSPQLRQIVDRLEELYPVATGLLTMRRLGGAAVDPGEQGVNVETSASVVLRVFDGRRWFERSVTDVRSESLDRAQKELRAAAGEPGRNVGARKQRKTETFATRLGKDPATLLPTSWLGRAAALFDRARSAGGSRIVYRGAYVTVDDTRSVFIGAGRDLTQRVVRTRAGVVFVASTGSATTSEEAAHGMTGDLSAANISTDEMTEAADRALEALTARPAPGGDLEVILDPGLTALLAERCLAPALSGTAWSTGQSQLARSMGASIGSEMFSMSDVPAAEGELGSYFFDDEGWRPTRVDLIEAGTLSGALTDRASASALKLPRTGHARRTAAGIDAVASNLVVAPGDSELRGMIEDVKDGVLVEGAIVARADPRTLRFAARGARAKEIKAGRQTGRLYGDVDVTGALPDFLQSTRGVSRQVTRVLGHPSEPRSILAPYLLSKARISRG